MLEAHTARALDAAFAVQVDQITQRHMLGQMHFFIEQKAAVAGSIFHGQVLQRAFAALVANRAIQRMRGQQEFQHILAGSLSLSRSYRTHHHAFRDRCGAGSFQFGPKTEFSACHLLPVTACPVARSIAGRPISTRHMRHMPTGSILGW